MTGMHGRLRFKLTMRFYVPILLASVAVPGFEKIATHPVSRAKRDISTGGEHWKQIEAHITELLSACGDYDSGPETIISAVKALRDANSRLLSSVENASLSIRMLVDDAVFPSFVSLRKRKGVG